ncbi:hypothetical protein Leryth_013383 [Lithospermum erythrorhizon]|nr:hypothetical protein Leryth_013383 [Lithospermum erythrorhizon]
MKKWSGGVLVMTLTLILVIRYSTIVKSPRKQSAYEFFNDHSAPEGEPKENDNGDGKSSETKQVKLYSIKKERPKLVGVEGLEELYNFGNFSENEAKSLLVWGKMRLLLSRSDALPETAQGIKEASISWKELKKSIEMDRISKLDSVKENITCPYMVSASNATMSRSGNNLEIPCGLVEDSSITVIGIPDIQQGSFQIELIGSQLPEERRPPIVLHYNVFSAGENFTKEPVIIQNSWISEAGWGNQEKCPNHGSTESVGVDGLAKCNAKVIRTSAGDSLNDSFSGNDLQTNVSDGSASMSATFPFVEGNPFTATLWVGNEGFHMTVNGRHETSFSYRNKLEPWLVTEVNVHGGVEILSLIASGLPVSEDLDLTVNIEHLMAPPIPKKRLKMLVGVFSTGNNFERRLALRKSWMQYEAVRSGDVAVRFFIGLDKNKQVNIQLWKEAQTYGDIQLMPFVDYYSLLTLKTIAICIFGTKILPAKYIMKTDDDAFVRIDEVLSHLKGKASDGILYGLVSFESKPHREKDNKWFISDEEWPHPSFPPWAHGPGYIISRDIAKFIVRGHEERDLILFKLEDVSVGIWIDQFKNMGHQVQYINDDRFFNAGCEQNYILAHYQNPRMVLCLWEKLKKEHEPNCCE